MLINYMPDHEFHAEVDLRVENAIMETRETDREALDTYVTETLLADGTWPSSWEALMMDAEKSALIARIVSERKQRGTKK